MGVDRLVMLRVNKERIQEVIAFPLLREMLENDKINDERK
jgi:lysyl-tRNA synthetase class II